MWKMAKETPLAQATWCLKKHPNGKCTGSFKKNRKQNRNDLFSRCFKLFDLFNQQNCFWMGCLSLVLFIGMTNPRQAFAYGPKTGAAFLRFFLDMRWSRMILFLAHAQPIDPTQDLCVGWITSGTSGTQLLGNTSRGCPGNAQENLNIG